MDKILIGGKVFSYILGDSKKRMKALLVVFGEVQLSLHFSLLQRFCHEMTAARDLAPLSFLPWGWDRRLLVTALFCNRISPKAGTVFRPEVERSRRRDSKLPRLRDNLGNRLDFLI